MVAFSWRLSQHEGRKASQSDAYLHFVSERSTSLFCWISHDHICGKITTSELWTKFCFFQGCGAPLPLPQCSVRSGGSQARTTSGSSTGGLRVTVVANPSGNQPSGDHHSSSTLQPVKQPKERAEPSSKSRLDVNHCIRGRALWRGRLSSTNALWVVWCPHLWSRSAISSCVWSTWGTLTKFGYSMSQCPRLASSVMWSSLAVQVQQKQTEEICHYLPQRAAAAVCQPQAQACSTPRAAHCNCPPLPLRIWASGSIHGIVHGIVLVPVFPRQPVYQFWRGLQSPLFFHMHLNGYS